MSRKPYQVKELQVFLRRRQDEDQSRPLGWRQVICGQLSGADGMLDLLQQRVIFQLVQAVEEVNALLYGWSLFSLLLDEIDQSWVNVCVIFDLLS